MSLIGLPARARQSVAARLRCPYSAGRAFCISNAKGPPMKNHGGCLLLAIPLAISACDTPPPASQVAATPATPAAPPPPLPAPGSVSSASTDESARVQEDYRRYTLAAESGDWDTIFSLTHPKVIEASGGRDAMRQQARPAVKVVSISFPTAPTFLKGRENEYVVVPWTMVISAGERRIEATGSQLGVRSSGSSQWTYMDGSGQDRAELTQHFPDFPADYQFPVRSKREVNER